MDVFFRGEMVNRTWEWGDLKYTYANPTNDLVFMENAIVLDINYSEEMLYLDYYPPIEDLTIVETIDTFSPDSSRNGDEIIWNWEDEFTLYLSGYVSEEVYESVKIPVPSPSLYFLKSFGIALEEAGIVYNSERVIYDPIDEDSLRILYEHQSPPLQEIVDIINHQSNNLFAESILRIMGWELYGEASLRCGLQSLDSLVGYARINPESLNFSDGCGLSRHNWVSAAAICDLLKFCKDSEFASIFRHSLPSFDEGTFKRNKADEALKQLESGNPIIFHAKTGSMSGVRSLSGYLEFGDEALIFSFICNNYSCASSLVENAIGLSLASLLE